MALYSCILAIPLSLVGFWLRVSDCLVLDHLGRHRVSRTVLKSMRTKSTSQALVKVQAASQEKQVSAVNATGNGALKAWPQASAKELTIRSKLRGVSVVER